MKRYEVSWIEKPEVQPEDGDKVCKQVYVWVVTKDKNVVVVSKDGEDWQLPGGKPHVDEGLSEAAVREVYEETNLDISDLSDNLHFFGYQTVKDLESSEPPYLQVRYLLELSRLAATLELGAQNEDDGQKNEDTIRFVGAVSLQELVNRIPWLEGSSEYAAVKSLIAADSTS